METRSIGLFYPHDFACRTSAPFVNFPLNSLSSSTLGPPSSISPFPSTSQTPSSTFPYPVHPFPLFPQPTRPISTPHSLRLLPLLPPKIATRIRRLDRLLRQALDRKPSLPRSRRRALIRHQRIAPLPRLRNGPLHKATLAIPCPEKNRIQQEQNPAALGKGKRRQQHAEPEQDFQGRDKRHAGVVVLLYKAADRVGERGRGLGTTAAAAAGRSSRCGGLGGRDGGDKVGTRVRGDVEDGVDGEGEEGERDLVGEEPGERHD